MVNHKITFAKPLAKYSKLTLFRKHAQLTKKITPTYYNTACLELQS